MNSGTPQLSQVAVIGGSVAGLLTARVLSEVAAQVVVVRDRLPQTNIPRRGVPQSVQPHVLFTKGYCILESLFQGIGEDLKAAGAIPVDWGKDFRYFHQGSWNATCQDDSGLVSVTCTRHLLETTIRKHVAKLSNIQWIENSRVQGLVGDHNQVSGIRYLAIEQGHVETLTAEFVIDASGRSSKASKWLSAIDASTPPVTIINPTSVMLLSDCALQMTGKPIG